MKLSILLIAVLAILACTETVHGKKKLAKVGVGLLGKALAGKALLKAPKLISKAAIGGVGLIGAKKLIGKIKHKKAPCASATVLLRRRRSVADYAKTMFNSASKRIENTGNRLRSVGDTIHRGSDRLKSLSLSTRAAGVIASNRLRNGLTGLTRTRRAAPRRPSARIPLPQGRLSLDEMFQFVRSYNGETCLERIICELSSNSNIYGEEGVRFGTRLLNYNNSTHQEASRYRTAAKVGNQNRGRPSQCRRRYSSCQYDPKEFIEIGNMILN